MRTGPRLLQRYGLALSILVLLAVMEQSVLQRLLSLQEDAAHRVNLAGRQRMLSQRLAKELLQGDEGARATIEEWGQRHRQLAAGEHSAALVLQFQEVGAELEQQQGRALSALAGDDLARQGYLRREGLLLHKLDHLVLLLEDQARQAIFGLETVSALIFVAFLLCLALEAGYIFWPSYREVSQSQQDLERRNQELSQALAVRDQFLGMVSHELRTPLNVILGMAELLAQAPLEPVQAEHLRDLERSGRALLGSINQLLDFFHLQTGQLRLYPEGFPLQDLLADCEAAVRISAQKKRLELKWELDPALAPFQVGDRLRLQQVLVNLLNNAIKFSQQGSVCLQVRSLAGQVRFEVSDFGSGIAPEHQQLIFEGFRQLEAGAQRRQDGLGLGLSISQHLLLIMGSGLQLESQLGQGSRFAFELPDQPCLPSQVRDRHHPPSLPPGLRLNILVVEDNELNRRLLVSHLRALGQEPAVVNDGAQAWSRLQQGAFDLLLLDVHMPVMNGLELLQRLALQAELRPVWTVVVSAACSEADRARALAAGCDDFLAKPFTRAQLIRQLEMAARRQSQPLGDHSPPV